ncbi:DUF3820 family protein [Desulfosediminicola sp.]|uniref:DUF3820 family protein n=1 Tax=Desulfosediminicola sp. TaxID=2886825 RepID=UPI003AF21692
MIDDKTNSPGQVMPFDYQALLELTETKMPFGKYSGRLLIDLPERYVVWFAGEGFPPGKLGVMLQTVYEIKVNGLEYLFDPIRKTPRKKV